MDLCKDAKLPTSGNVDVLKHRVVTGWLRSASQSDIEALGADPPEKSTEASSLAQPVHSAASPSIDKVATAATELKDDVAKPNKHQEAGDITKVPCHVFTQI